MAYCTIKHAYCKDAGTITVQLCKELDGRNGIKTYTMCYATYNDLPCPYDVEHDMQVVRSFITEVKENKLNNQNNE